MWEKRLLSLEKIIIFREDYYYYYYSAVVLLMLLQLANVVLQESGPSGEGRSHGLRTNEK